MERENTLRETETFSALSNHRSFRKREGSGVHVFPIPDLSLPFEIIQTLV